MNEIGASIFIVSRNIMERRVLRRALAGQGYVVAEAFDTTDISAIDVPIIPTAILLDLDDPHQVGLATVLKFKDKPRTAIVAISAETDSAAKVAALDLGADDYITRPLSLDELSARLRAALRHAAWKEQVTTVVAFGDVKINPANRQVQKAGERVHLTRKEYDVLSALASSPGRILTHQQIMERAWPLSIKLRVEYLRIVVRSLRQKLEPDPAHPILIINELGIGYRLNITRLAT